MATVNFSVPEDVKQAFNQQFKGRNKSAIIAELMQDAIEADRLAERRTRLMNDLMERRSLRPRVNADDAESARAAMRSDA